MNAKLKSHFQRFLFETRAQFSLLPLYRFLFVHQRIFKDRLLFCGFWLRNTRNSSGFLSSELPNFCLINAPSSLLHSTNLTTFTRSFRFMKRQIHKPAPLFWITAAHVRGEARSPLAVVSTSSCCGDQSAALQLLTGTWQDLVRRPHFELYS